MTDIETNIPKLDYWQIFTRFLKFGFLAWGGPVAQIALIRQELVDEEHWISREKFHRVLAVYQVLPGPEASEMCVYFGMLAGGRIGAVLAGLAFVLPGFLFMLALSWFYVAVGIQTPFFQSVFFGFQAAVAALILRAVHRLSEHSLRDVWLAAIALGVGIGQYFNVSFWITLGLAGAVYAFIKQRPINSKNAIFFIPISIITAHIVTTAPGVLSLFIYGLRSGLLTFGGAYTAIPFLQHDAVVNGGWMTNQQFMDGLALSSILPAPLIIFSTFVGYLGGGMLGATVITIGIFSPAFLFTLIGHNFFEKWVENKSAHAFLDGVAAGVIGLIAVTAIGLFRTAITGIPSFLIFILCLIILYLWKAKPAVAFVVLGAGLLGYFFL